MSRNEECTIELFGDEWDVKKCRHPKLGLGFEIDFTEMYEAPTLSYKMMKELSELFGTEEIDFDEYSQGGCESCDYGSAYGYRVQVYRATMNKPKFTRK